MDAEENADDGKKKTKNKSNLLKDDRFSAMFSNPEFQIDTESEDYRLLNPVISKLDKAKKNKQKEMQQFKEVHDDDVDDELEGEPSDEASSSSDDEHTWTEEVKKQHRLIKKQDKQRKDQMPQFYEIKEGQDLSAKKDKSYKMKNKQMKKSLEERLQMNDSSIISESGAVGNKELTFKFKKNEKESKRQLENRLHHQERKKIRRSAGDIVKNVKQKPKYWMGKRVK